MRIIKLWHFEHVKPLKISRNLIYRTIKRYKELWGAEDRARSGRLKIVRAESAIKTVRERIRRNPLWKQKIMSRELNISTQSSCASSGTIYTWQRTSAQRDTHLPTPALKEIRRTRAERLLQWYAGNGHENILFTDEKFFTIEEQYNNQNKIYAQTSLEVHSEGAGMPSPFLRHGLVWGVPSGVTHLHFCKKGVKLVSECMKRTCCKELWNSLTWPSSVVRNGSSGRTQFLPKSQDDSGVTAEERSGLYQCRELALGKSRLQPQELKFVGCFGGHGLPKSVTTTWTVWRDLSWKQRQRSSWRRCEPR